MPTEQLPSDTKLMHASDCAIYNEPALPAGPCNCGVLAPDGTTPSRDPPPGAAIQSDTPKTDAESYWDEAREQWVCHADVARAQERRINRLLALLTRCVEPITEHHDDNKDRRAAYEGYEQRQRRFDAALFEDDELLEAIRKETQP